MRAVHGRGAGGERRGVRRGCAGVGARRGAGFFCGAAVRDRGGLRALAEPAGGAAGASFAGSVAWRASLEEMPPFTGVHFSNELVDAFPVHLVRYSAAAMVRAPCGRADGWTCRCETRRLLERLARRPAHRGIHHGGEPGGVEVGGGGLRQAEARAGCWRSTTDFPATRYYESRAQQRNVAGVFRRMRGEPIRWPARGWPI